MKNITLKNPKNDNDEYCTPDDLWAEIREVFFNGESEILDPCPSDFKKLESTVFCKETSDGLREDWTKYNNIFVNPPFSNISPWAGKAYFTALSLMKNKKDNFKICLLLPVRSEMSWWHTFLPASRIVFIRRRVNFFSPKLDKIKKGCSFPSCLSVFDVGSRCGTSYWEPHCLS